MTIDRLTAEQFALIFSSRGPTLAWFIGAGTSAAAGVPTGYDMILDFKTRLFCGAARIPRSEVDPGDPLWSERITSYLDGAHGLPPNGHSDEYAATFEAVYPDPSDRRAYIDKAVRHGSPSFGHRVFASLLSSRQVPAVFTTNFDPLVEEATVETDALLPVADRIHLTVSAIDNAERAERCLRESAWPLLAKLHGDFQSEQLKNIGDELSHQDARLRRVLVDSCQRFGLVVAGYSGRDASVMDALGDALRSEGAFRGGLFWVTQTGGTLLPAAKAFLEQAIASGTDVHVVEAENFDELAGALDRQLTLLPVLTEHVRAARPAARVQPVVIPTVEAGRFPALRATALPLVALPTAARRITLTKTATTRELQQLLRDAGFRRTVVASHGYEVAAFGSDVDLLAGLASLGPQLDGEITLDPASDSWALGLLYEALTRALARRQPLRPQRHRRGHSLVIVPPDASRGADLARLDEERIAPVRSAYAGALTGTVPEIGIPFAEGADLRLELWFDRWWCVFDPYTWVDIPRREADGATGEVLDVLAIVTAAQDWRRERWAGRYNKNWSRIIAAWASLIAPDRETTVYAFGLRDTPGVDASFVISQVTAWSPPGYGLQASKSSPS